MQHGLIDLDLDIDKSKVYETGNVPLKLIVSAGPDHNHTNTKTQN